MIAHGMINMSMKSASKMVNFVFIKAIEVILPGGEIENVDFSVDIIYEKTDDQIDTLFASKIVNDSLLKKL